MVRQVAPPWRRGARLPFGHRQCQGPQEGRPPRPGRAGRRSAGAPRWV